MNCSEFVTVCSKMEEMEEVCNTSCVGAAQLINLVHMYPITYNSKLKEFRNEVMKNHAWACIADAMNISVEDVKRNWASLRTTYGREVKKQELSSESGSTYNSREWIHFQSMSFLKPFLKRRRSYGNVSAPKLTTITHTNVADEDPLATPSTPPKPCYAIAFYGPPTSPVALEQETDATFKKKKRKLDYVDQNILESLKMFSETSKKRVVEEETKVQKSENEKFCMTISAMMNRVPDEKLKELKKSIFSMCLDAQD